MATGDIPAAAGPRASLALFYAAHFGHVGIVLPFLPLWLMGRDLDAASIGLLVALSPLSKVLAPWTWGRLADRSGRRRGLLLAVRGRRGRAGRGHAAIGARAPDDRNRAVRVVRRSGRAVRRGDRPRAGRGPWLRLRARPSVGIAAALPLAALLVLGALGRTRPPDQSVR